MYFSEIVGIVMIFFLHAQWSSVMRAEHSLASSEARSAGNQIEFRSLSQSLTSEEFTRLDKNLNNVCGHKSCWSNRLC